MRRDPAVLALVVVLLCWPQPPPSCKRLWAQLASCRRVTVASSPHRGCSDALPWLYHLQDRKGEVKLELARREPWPPDPAVLALVVVVLCWPQPHAPLKRPGLHSALTTCATMVALMLCLGYNLFRIPAKWRPRCCCSGARRHHHLKVMDEPS